MHHLKIYLCAGGTGGHLFPALATARILKSKKYCITLISDKEVDEAGLESVHITIPRRSNKRQLPLFIFAMIMSFLKCLLLFWKEKPELVVGFGGYPSVPAVLAAQILRIPTLLHEQNAVLGRANRYLLKRAQLVAVSFDKTLHITKKTPHILTGNPVRLKPCSLYQPKGNGCNLLVLGGSQGAAIFSTLIPEALSLLSKNEQSKITLTLQCRSELLESTHIALHSLGIKATLAPFFDTMQDLYENADFIIARSGASTVSEVTVAGRAALFVPYPHAMDNHQYHNAKAMQSACFLMEQKNLTPEKLSDLLRDCLQSPDMLKNKAQAIQHYSMANAATHLAHVIEDLLP